MLGLFATFASYAMACVVLYYVVMCLVALLARARVVRTSDEHLPLFVFLVPMRNEELVIDATVESLMGVRYEGEWRVLLVNDGSTDATSSMAARWAARDDRIRVLDRSTQESGRGKGDALNAGYALLSSWLRAADGWFAGNGRASVILGVVDADGSIDENCLTEVTRYFGDPKTGGVQIGVRIGNATTSVLARMQDMEFVAFSWLVQVARDNVGSVGLGGNGQFTRMSALLDLGDAPWSPTALTEDLDLGLSLAEIGWRNRFCGRSFVTQQGITTWRAYMRQRTRWIQGHYQCWTHLPKIWRSRHLRTTTKLDLTLYLTMVSIVMLVTVMLILGLLAGYGVISVRDTFLIGVVPYADLHLVNFWLAVSPLLIFTLNYQVKASRPFKWYEFPAGAMLFALYAYVGAVATLRAWYRMLRGRRDWVKTPRLTQSQLAGSER
jgi:1,2-diacylglycerol 3-beta-glucosyltransferase